MNARVDLRKRYAAVLALPLVIACSGLAAEPLQRGGITEKIEPVPRAQMPVPIAQPPVCANPSVTLAYTTLENGTVRLTGTVANRGALALNVPVEVQYVMNVSYPPKTYSQVGISEQLCTQSFQGLAPGQILKVDCSYRIPDFANWIQDRPPHLPTRPAAQPTDAKRLFTLRVVRSDMAPFTSSQDCNAADNQTSVELSYRTVAPATAN
jgi:hypothetical protein